jgi:hypothetical protein
LKIWNGGKISEDDFKKLPIPKNSGPELDLLLALHMGWKHWSGSELTVKMHLEEISKNPTVTIPKFSTDHNAFFDHVAAHFVNLDMGFDVSYLVEDQMWQVVIKNKNESFTGKDFELPHAGSLAAISALRKI